MSIFSKIINLISGGYDKSKEEYQSSLSKNSSQSDKELVQIINKGSFVKKMAAQKELFDRGYNSEDIKRMRENLIRNGRI